MKSLQILAGAEETVVREEAVRSLDKISSNLNQDDNLGIIVPCIMDLSASEYFTHKVSAINLMSCIFDRAGSQQESLRKYAKFIEEVLRLVCR